MWVDSDINEYPSLSTDDRGYLWMPINLLGGLGAFKSTRSSNKYVSLRRPGPWDVGYSWEGGEGAGGALLPFVDWGHWHKMLVQDLFVCLSSFSWIGDNLFFVNHALLTPHCAPRRSKHYGCCGGGSCLVERPSTPPADLRNTKKSTCHNNLVNVRRLPLWFSVFLDMFMVR